MSGGVSDMAGRSTAWQNYLDQEHYARDRYLQITQKAHREYLTGPWPDRDAYQAVERSAWVNYYHAGRAAWQDYKREMENPPPPAQPTNPYPEVSGGGVPYTPEHHIKPPQPTFNPFNPDGD